MFQIVSTYLQSSSRILPGQKFRRVEIKSSLVVSCVEEALIALYRLYRRELRAGRDGSGGRGRESQGEEGQEGQDE